MGSIIVYAYIVSAGYQKSINECTYNVVEFVKFHQVNNSI